MGAPALLSLSNGMKGHPNVCASETLNFQSQISMQGDGMPLRTSRSMRKRCKENDCSIFGQPFFFSRFSKYTCYFCPCRPLPPPKKASSLKNLQRRTSSLFPTDKVDHGCSNFEILKNKSRYKHHSFGYFQAHLIQIHILDPESNTVESICVLKDMEQSRPPLSPISILSLALFIPTSSGRQWNSQRKLTTGSGF